MVNEEDIEKMKRFMGNVAVHTDDLGDKRPSGQYKIFYDLLDEIKSLRGSNNMKEKYIAGLHDYIRLQDDICQAADKFVNIGVYDTDMYEVYLNALTSACLQIEDKDPQ